MYAYILPLLMTFSSTSGHPCNEICCYHEGITECLLNGTGFEALNQIATNVTKLQITSNNLGVLEQPYFKDFIHLQELVLDFNMIRTVNYSAFEGLIRLEKIVLAHNEITRLEDKVFTHCPMLKNIELSYNHNLELRGVIGALKELRIEKLILSRIESVTEISKSDFLSLAGSQLKELDLSWCSIEEIEKGAFAVLSSLERLSLSGNKLNDGDLSNAFFNISSTLIHLDLSELQLTDIPLRSLELLSSTRLRQLDLGGNLFTRIIQFPQLPYLEQLYLKDNRLSSFYTRVIMQNLTNLWELNLSNNLIRYIDVSIPIVPQKQALSIPRSTKLTHLHLHRNKLTCKLVHEYLSHLTSLSYLDLSRNCLCDISLIVVKLSPTITHLNLTRNGIESWSKPLNLKNLKTLLLHENSLNIITDQMLQDFGNLATLDVSKNPFDCDHCNVGEFGQLLNNTDITIQNKDQVKCEKPEELYGIEVIHTTMPEYCQSETERVVEFLATCGSLIIIFGVVVYHFRWHIRYYWWRYVVNSKKKPHKYCWWHNVITIHSTSAIDWITKEMRPNLSYLKGNLNIALVGELPAGEDYIDNTTAAIENSDTIILLLDNEFLADSMCLFELNYANFHVIDSRSKKGLIFIVLEDFENDSPKLKYLMETRHCLKWTDSEHKRDPKVFWAKLKYYLEKPQKPIPKGVIPLHVFV